MTGRSKRPFEYDLPERVTHEEYQRQVERRGRADRVLAVLVFLCGTSAVLGVILALVSAPLGSYTRHPVTDLIVHIFVFCGGVYFLMKSQFLWSRFLCRFCLKRVPEGATQCLSCRADLLSNDNPQPPIM